MIQTFTIENNLYRLTPELIAGLLRDYDRRIMGRCESPVGNYLIKEIERLPFSYVNWNGYDRDLSGCYIRTQDENGKWVSKDITDCTEIQMRKYLATKEKEELINWVVYICKAFREMGDELNIHEGS